MPMHDDLYIRDDLADDGNFPNSFGGLSPDIISRKKPIHPKSVRKTLVESWAQRIDEAVLKNGFNSIYVRAKNLGGTDSKGTVDVYWTEGGLLQAFKWYQASHLVGQFTIGIGPSSQPVPSKQIGDCREGKLWKPPAEMQTTTHYCMVGHLSTAKHPNKIPKDEIKTVDQFWSWVRANPGIAVRNFDFEKIEKDNDWVLELRNMEGERAFEIVAKLQGLPVGTEGWLYCPDPDCGFLEEFKIESEMPTAVPVSAILKGHFEKPLHIKLQLPEQALPEKWQVELVQYALPKEGDLFLPRSARPLLHFLDGYSVDGKLREELGRKAGEPVGSFRFFSESASGRR